MEPTKRLYCVAGSDALDLEDRERYRPGGYHPVHFNDYLDPENRFLVLQKLGWGISSTVWLCYDQKSRLHKSIKILTAEGSAEGCPELQVMKALAGASHNELRDNYINIPRDHFWINGPNGRHLCLVSDLLGPSLSTNRPDGMDLHTPESLTELAFQISKGLQYLHHKGICHGDLNTSNILIELNAYDLMELTARQVDRYLGPPKYVPLERVDGTDPKPHGPSYLAFPASLDILQKKCPTRRVAIIDFSHSFYCSDPPTSPECNRQYAAPELLFSKALGGTSQDIWALACTIYEIKTRMPLFSEYQDYKSFIRQLEVWFGPLPTEYRQLAWARIERGHSSPVRPIAEGDLFNTDQPISLSSEEEQNARKISMGKSEWPNPLQAALGREQDCFVYERNNEAYTSSEDTEFDTESSGHESQDWASDDGNVQDIYAQADLIFDGIEEDILTPGSFDGDTARNSNSPMLQVADITENGLGQAQGEESLGLPTIPAENIVVSPEYHKRGRSETESATSEMIFQEVLRKRDADDSPDDRDAKRLHMSEEPIKKGGEWVKHVVSMPKEEVISLSDLLMRMFNYDPKERIDIDAVLNHDFWGDRRYYQPTSPGNSVDNIPNPISSRTRSRALKVEEQVGHESGSSGKAGPGEPTESEPTDALQG